MIWLILLLLMLVGALWGLTRQYRNDRRFLQKRTRDVLSPQVQKEIDIEIHEAKLRQEKFKQALDNASKSAKSNDNSLT
jgi:hypothetical protein